MIKIGGKTNWLVTNSPAQAGGFVNSLCGFVTSLTKKEGFTMNTKIIRSLFPGLFLDLARVTVRQRTGPPGKRVTNPHRAMCFNLLRCGFVTTFLVLWCTTALVLPLYAAENTFTDDIRGKSGADVRLDEGIVNTPYGGIGRYGS